MNPGQPPPRFSPCSNPDCSGSYAHPGPCQTGVHTYLSTYCWHRRCGDCRRTCKHCEARCICDCHRPAHGDAA